MRRAGFAIFALAALAACNPSGSGEGAGDQTATAAFPNLSGASYRAEATITDEGGRSLPVVMIRDGAKMRMEVVSGEGQSVVVNNADTGESFIITTAGGQTMAMRTSALSQFENPADKWNAEYAATATRTGDCTGAGLQGAEWTRDDNGSTNTVCVTDDGILLRVAEGERTVWETTQVTRGPQAPELFVVPPGVQVVDMNNIGGVADALRQAQQGH